LLQVSLMAIRNWNRDELLVVFNLYCRTPFGKLHKGNPEVIALAQRIGRTPSSVAMKLVNFASLDPVQQARRIRGLGNVSRADREIWDEFNSNPEQFAFESQQALTQMSGEILEISVSDIRLPTGPTETIRLVRARLVQGFFRDAVLSSYEFKCAICSFDLPECLSASHIIPWSQNIERRADPRNGLSLCAMHDRAFDRGLIALDESSRILLATRARLNSSESRLQTVALIEVEGKAITLPQRFAPDPEALAYHRENIFKP
jgi:putative restriction endonuclease